jgi:tetratricopeptide (TPR) repeat protein
MASSAPTVPATPDLLPSGLARRPCRFVALLVTAAVLLLVAVAAAGLDDQARDTPAGTPQPVPDRLAASIQQAQDRLRRLPGDADTWAGLGTAYVEQARVSANPAYYAQAQGALERSLALRPDGNAAAAVGLGALANARHDFATARRHAEQALALNPASAEANGVLADAATQLGDTATATAAVQRMLDLRPGVAAFTRASYELELHGRVDEARTALQRALDGATSRDELAFSHFYLGELAWGGGDLEEARAQYERGLAAAPGDPMLLSGRAKVLVATGRVDEAITAYARLTERVPLPGYLLEYGELLQSAGRLPEADVQYRLLAEQQRLNAAQGSTDDAAAALVAADHGDPAEAVALAEAEWQRRQSIFSADALAWALHAAGRDAEALPLIDRAGALGRRDATVAYHRGMILAGLSRTEPARTGEAVAALEQALSTNPHFSPLHAGIARQTLDALRGRS